MRRDAAMPIYLSIAAPAYNEEEGIGTVIQYWHTFLKNQSDIAGFEIIICNDGSKDSTRSVLEKLHIIYPELRCIHFQKNQGAAAALSAAIAKTQYEWVLLMDSDDQFPIENLPVMISCMRDTEAKAILGVRNKRDHLLACLGSKLSGAVCNLVHGSRLKDFNSAFKLIYGSILRQLNLEAKGMNYSTEITSRLLEVQVPLAEVNIDHRIRSTGKSHIKLLKDSLHRLLFVGYLSWRQLLLKWQIIRRSNDEGT